ncbi:MAG: hypothetical protein EAZ97_15400 [Bacteroidetes bacterium]|nr:MAG: hypothetical protein EAZ97_15400 [Bacteroidota bacterium]
MKKIGISLLLFLAVILFQCKDEKKTESQDLAVQYPNKDSELALLMREMYTDTETLKKAIENKTLPPDFREKFKKIHSAIPTDPKVKTESFAQLSNNFLNNLDQLYTSSNRVEGLETLIGSCIACHQNFCPGPIKRIKKLSTKTAN